MDTEFYEEKLLDELHETAAKYEKGEISKKEMEGIIDKMEVYRSSIDEALHELNRLIESKSQD